MIDVLTLFPRLIEAPLRQSLLKKAQEKNLVEVRIRDIREFALDKHKTADDVPFGGGAGMVMKPEPICLALDEVLKTNTDKNVTILLTSPQGAKFTQKKALDLSKQTHLIIICGHYTGVDERVKLLYPVEEISVGDYILTGGEAAALVIIDATVRLLPGVLGNFAAAEEDSFYSGLLGYPQYTRPQIFRGLEVPEILVSGDHKKIARWRRKEALKKTLEMRPDLLKSFNITETDKKILEELKKDEI